MSDQISMNDTPLYNSASKHDAFQDFLHLVRLLFMSTLFLRFILPLLLLPGLLEVVHVYIGPETLVLEQSLLSLLALGYYQYTY